MKTFQKSILILALFSLFATCAWSQTPQRSMFHDGMISNMESKIGDLTVTQENQFIIALNAYNKTPASQKQDALVDYQAELKQILTPQKYAILNQDPSMKKVPGFGSAASTN